MKAAILNVGDEVLSGKIVNTNSSFLSHELEMIGVETKYVSVVGDDKEMLISEIKRFNESDCDLLITTGGLGPTHDDFTKEVVFGELGLKLELNNDALKILNNYFKGEYAKCNEKQAYFPKEAIIIPNLKGTACGAIVEKNSKIYVILVGPPFEMKPMVIETLLPYLKSKINNDLIIKEYQVTGIGESSAEEILIDLINKYSFVSIAPYASVHKIRYQITSHKKYQKEFNEVCTEFESIMDEYIISTTNQSIEEVVVEKLRELGYYISTAESCTGGMIASTIVNVNGSSAVFKESLVTYSNEAKIKYLDVQEKTIEEFGVVSEEVVSEMAYGLRKLTSSEVCLTVSGIAGPTGGTDKKPVGLVHFAILINDNLYTFNKVFRGDREMVRKRATYNSLYEVYKLLKKIK